MESYLHTPDEMREVLDQCRHDAARLVHNNAVETCKVYLSNYRVSFDISKDNMQAALELLDMIKIHHPA